MAKLLKSRYSQEVQVLEFPFRHDDTMTSVAGSEADFGATNTSSTVFAVAKLPPGAVVIGGDLVRTQAFDAATYTVSVGDADSATRYMAATDVKAVGRTALVPTGYAAGGDVQITVVPADACTTGEATLRIMFVIAGRAGEVTGG